MDREDTLLQSSYLDKLNLTGTDFNHRPRPLKHARGVSEGPPRLLGTSKWKLREEFGSQNESLGGPCGSQNGSLAETFKKSRASTCV